MSVKGIGIIYASYAIILVTQKILGNMHILCIEIQGIYINKKKKIFLLIHLYRTQNTT